MKTRQLSKKWIAGITTLTFMISSNMTPVPLAWAVTDMVSVQDAEKSMPVTSESDAPPPPETAEPGANMDQSLFVATTESDIPVEDSAPAETPLTPETTSVVSSSARDENPPKEEAVNFRAFDTKAELISIQEFGEDNEYYGFRGPNGELYRNRNTFSAGSLLSVGQTLEKFLGERIHVEISDCRYDSCANDPSIVEVHSITLIDDSMDEPPVSSPNTGTEENPGMPAVVTMTSGKITGIQVDGQAVDPSQYEVENVSDCRMLHALGSAMTCSGTVTAIVNTGASPSPMPGKVSDSLAPKIVASYSSSSGKLKHRLSAIVEGLQPGGKVYAEITGAIGDLPVLKVELLWNGELYSADIPLSIGQYSFHSLACNDQDCAVSGDSPFEVSGDDLSSGISSEPVAIYGSPAPEMYILPSSSPVAGIEPVGSFETSYTTINLSEASPSASTNMSAGAVVISAGENSVMFFPADQSGNGNYWNSYPTYSVLNGADPSTLGYGANAIVYPNFNVKLPDGQKLEVSMAGDGGATFTLHPAVISEENETSATTQDLNPYETAETHVITCGMGGLLGGNVYCTDKSPNDIHFTIDLTQSIPDQIAAGVEAKIDELNNNLSLDDIDTSIAFIPPPPTPEDVIVSDQGSQYAVTVTLHKEKSPEPALDPLPTAETQLYSYSIFIPGGPDSAQVMDGFTVSPEAMANCVAGDCSGVGGLTHMPALDGDAALAVQQLGLSGPDKIGAIMRGRGGAMGYFLYVITTAPKNSVPEVDVVMNQPAYSPEAAAVMALIEKGITSELSFIGDLKMELDHFKTLCTNDEPSSSCSTPGTIEFSNNGVLYSGSLTMNSNNVTSDQSYRVFNVQPVQTSLPEPKLLDMIPVGNLSIATDHCKAFSDGGDCLLGGSWSLGKNPALKFIMPAAVTSAIHASLSVEPVKVTDAAELAMLREKFKLTGDIYRKYNPVAEGVMDAGTSVTYYGQQPGQYVPGQIDEPSTFESPDPEAPAENVPDNQNTPAQTLRTVHFGYTFTGGDSNNPSSSMAVYEPELFGQHVLKTSEEAAAFWNKIYGASRPMPAFQEGKFWVVNVYDNFMYNNQFGLTSEATGNLTDGFNFKLVPPSVPGAFGKAVMGNPVHIVEVDAQPVSSETGGKPTRDDLAGMLDPANEDEAALAQRLRNDASSVDIDGVDHEILADGTVIHTPVGDYPFEGFAGEGESLNPFNFREAKTLLSAISNSLERRGLLGTFSLGFQVAFTSLAEAAQFVLHVMPNLGVEVGLGFISGGWTNAAGQVAAYIFTSFEKNEIGAGSRIARIAGNLKALTHSHVENDRLPSDTDHRHSAGTRRQEAVVTKSQNLHLFTGDPSQNQELTGDIVEKGMKYQRWVHRQLNASGAEGPDAGLVVEDPDRPILADGPLVPAEQAVPLVIRRQSRWVDPAGEGIGGENLWTWNLNNNGIETEGPQHIMSQNSTREWITGLTASEVGPAPEAFAFLNNVQPTLSLPDGTQIKRVKYLNEIERLFRTTQRPLNSTAYYREQTAGGQVNYYAFSARDPLIQLQPAGPQNPGADPGSNWPDGVVPPRIENARGTQGGAEAWGSSVMIQANIALGSQGVGARVAILGEDGSVLDYVNMTQADPASNLFQTTHFNPPAVSGIRYMVEVYDSMRQRVGDPVRVVLEGFRAPVNPDPSQNNPVAPPTEPGMGEPRPVEPGQVPFNRPNFVCQYAGNSYGCGAYQDHLEGPYTDSRENVSRNLPNHSAAINFFRNSGLRVLGVDNTRIFLSGQLSEEQMRGFFTLQPEQPADPNAPVNPVQPDPEPQPPMLADPSAPGEEEPVDPAWRLAALDPDTPEGMRAAREIITALRLAQLQELNNTLSEESRMRRLVQEQMARMQREEMRTRMIARAGREAGEAIGIGNAGRRVFGDGAEASFGVRACRQLSRMILAAR